MAVNERGLMLVIEELVLDGVAPDDPTVRESVARALAPSLEQNGLGRSTPQVVSAVMTAATQATAR
jgi:hypothetical protein